MSQDIVSDGLNRIMNAKNAGHSSVTLKHHSKFLQNILAIGKLKEYISEYSLTPKGLVIKFGKLNKCVAVKPRYIVKVNDIDKYVRRYLPARGIGIIIVSTSKGLVTHQTALDKNLGGSIIAYFY
ncbi:30S ribosomal protein S8 [Candidatus Pacearchaeota archaeon]|nr:30S ribosomal protein S8 [Candidatus Pacearchaeota archaeon]